jgi:flagellar motor switch protein FliN
VGFWSTCPTDTSIIYGKLRFFMPADLENAQQEAAAEADSAPDSPDSPESPESPAQPPSEAVPEEQASADAPAVEAAASEAAGAGAVAARSQAGSPEKQAEKLQRLLSMRVPVIVKVAEKKMSIGNMLKFHMGSIIQFDKDAYQQLELMINNSTIGLGQPIKIGEKFGLRITQVGEIAETIKSLSRHHVGPDT